MDGSKRVSEQINSVKVFNGIAIMHQYLIGVRDLEEVAMWSRETPSSGLG